MQVKNLLKTNDALEESITKKIEIIESFESKMNNLEKKIDYLSCKEIMHCKETQTEAESLEKEKENVTVVSQQTQTESDINFKCDACNFEGVNGKEQRWHMGKNHGWPSSLNDCINKRMSAHSYTISPTLTIKIDSIFLDFLMELKLHIFIFFE